MRASNSSRRLLWASPAIAGHLGHVKEPTISSPACSPWSRLGPEQRSIARLEGINLLIFRSLREAAPFSYRVSFINCGSTRRVASAARSDFDIGKLSAGLIGIGSEGGSSNRA
jgi:hypothetical protein